MFYMNINIQERKNCSNNKKNNTNIYNAKTFIGSREVIFIPIPLFLFVL